MGIRPKFTDQPLTGTAAKALEMLRVGTSGQAERSRALALVRVAFGGSPQALVELIDNPAVVTYDKVTERAVLRRDASQASDVMTAVRTLGERVAKSYRDQTPEYDARRAGVYYPGKGTRLAATTTRRVKGTAEVPERVRLLAGAADVNSGVVAAVNEQRKGDPYEHYAVVRESLQVAAAARMLTERSFKPVVSPSEQEPVVTVATFDHEGHGLAVATMRVPLEAYTRETKLCSGRVRPQIEVIQAAKLIQVSQFAIPDAEMQSTLFAETWERAGDTAVAALGSAATQSFVEWLALSDAKEPVVVPLASALYYSQRFTATAQEAARP